MKRIKKRSSFFATSFIFDIIICICNLKFTKFPSEVAKMLLDNAKKIYLVDYIRNDTGYKVGHYQKKIYLEYNCEMEYDARTGKYSYDDYCSCTKEVRMSPDGEIIDFDCKYLSE